MPPRADPFGTSARPRIGRSWGQSWVAATETHAATGVAAGRRFAIDLRERQLSMAPVMVFGLVVALVLVLSAVHAVWSAFRPT